MFDFIKNIFGSSKVIKKGLDMIDDMSYTPEEKAKHKTDLLKEYQPFKITQRFLAILFSLNFIAVLWVSIDLYFYHIGKLEGFYRLLGQFDLGAINSLIVGFYFGGGLLNGAIHSFNAKKEDLSIKK